MDIVNGPENALPRMDNLVLDETGALALRLGSSKVNSSAISGSDTNVRALYSVNISGVRYRLVQSGNTLFADSGAGFASITSGFSATQDIQFSSYLGQIFAANSTKKVKYNGTLRNWGIAAPSAAPTLSTMISGSTLTFSTCASAESPGMTSIEGTQSFVADRNAVANAACQIIADSTTLRGASSKTFASPQDFTSYGGGITSGPDDTVELYVKVDEPQKLSSITFDVDVNDGTFATDYFSHTWDSTSSEWPANANVWSYLSANRSEFSEVLSTSGKWWTTVKAVRVTFEGTGQATVVFDQIQQRGGNRGQVVGDDITYEYIYVRDDGTYVAKSGPSAHSANLVFHKEGATMTVTNPTDTQVTQIWLFRLGGTLDLYYRVATKAVAAYTGTTTIDDVTSDTDALTLNITLESDNQVPANNIIGISDDYYTRIFALTSDGKLYPSRKLNPDGFSSGQAITVGGASETPYWVKKTFGGLYVGTSKDIYRLDGTGAENPDGTLDFDLIPLNINSPPINPAVAVDGNILTYMASDGPRLLSGTVSSPLRAETDLLWRGYTRYDVGPVNLSGRFSMAISKNILTIVVPEATGNSGSAILYRHAFGKPAWYRHTYASTLGSVLWMTVFREPDGTLLAGTNNGFVWVLDNAAVSADNGTAIPVVIYFKTEDYGSPRTKKDPTFYTVRLDTGGTAAGLSFYLDGSTTAALNINPLHTGEGIFQYALDSLANHRQLTTRLTGSFTTFRFYDWSVDYIALPDGRTRWQIGPVDLGNGQDMVWLRKVKVKYVSSAAVSLSAKFDGTVRGTASIPAAGDPTNQLAFFGRECKGSQLSSFILDANGGECLLWWVEFTYRTSGGITQNKKITIGEVA